MLDATPALSTMAALPRGYSEGLFNGSRWCATVKASDDRRRWWLWAEQLGGPDWISANLYVLADGRALLKPCEMAAEKVEAFISGYRPGPLPAALRSE